MNLKDIPMKTYCEFKKGEHIIHQQEKIDYVYIITSGICYRTHISETGAEILYGIKRANTGLESVIGILVLFNGGISTSNFVAHTKCCCYKVPYETFYQYVISQQDLCVEMLHLAMKEYRAVTERFHAQSHKNNFGLLCKLLLDHSSIVDGKRSVEVGYNNKLLSEYLGIHQVTVSKMLKFLKEDGVIKKETKGIVILDESKLSRYVNEDKTMYW
ncbi:MAG: Crp/Fnr family transcriptional regulator [Desulfitobacterium sp.]